MNILHVIESLGTGGAERLLVTLLPELRQSGDDISVAVMRGPYDHRATLEGSGIRVIVLPNRGKWNLPARAWDIASCARRHSCDVVHAHLYFPAIATALSRHLRMARFATVVTFHNLAYLPGVNKPGPGLWLRRFLARTLYPRGFDAMLGVSHVVARHYEQALGLRHVDVLHNAVDLSVIDRLAAGSMRPVPDSSAIVVPGRLVPEKGHHDVIVAVALLRAQGHAVRAVLAGDGPLRNVLEKAIDDHGLREAISITGPMEYGCLLQLVAAARMVVIPSRAEGFGLTAVEAMALGRPVIASAIGGLPEVVEDSVSGVLVPAASPEHLAAAIKRLLHSPALCDRLGAAARLRVEERFSVVHLAPHLRRIYASIAPAPNAVPHHAPKGL